MAMSWHLLVSVTVLVLIPMALSSAVDKPFNDLISNVVIDDDAREALDPQVTEAPASDLVAQQLQKRAWVPCTQWSVVGGGGISIGCSTGSCAFATQSGRLYEFCGTEGPVSLYTNCFDYPIQPPGNPTGVIKCPLTLPYCGVFSFSLRPGAVYLNYGCAALPYNLLVVTTPGAVFPGSPAPSPSPSPSPTPIPATTTTTTTTTTRPVPTTSSTPGPVIAPPISPSTTSTTPIKTPDTPSTIVTTTSPRTTTPTTPSPVSTTPISLISTSFNDVAPTPVTVPCNDPLWEPTPENWYNASVDVELAKWWKSTATERGSVTFVDWLARSFGDMSRSVQCGIGLIPSCVTPACTIFQAAGAPRWAYFVRIAVVNLNILFNIMKEGMQDAESSLSLILNTMAADFFPWVDPRTDLQKALPWIQMIAEIILSFIPVIGPGISAAAKASKNFDRWAPAMVDSTRSLMDGGYQALESLQASSPVTQQIGTVIDLGALMKQVMSTMKGGLEEWAKVIFSGTADGSGKNIIDYMAGGRFTLNVLVSEKFLADAYFKIQIAKLVNSQWKDTTKAPSRTFVMCTNSTSATSTTCRDAATRIVDGARTCCLASVDGDGNLVTPPALEKLANPRYNVTGADAAAGSLNSYKAGGLVYDESRVREKLRATISLNGSDSFLVQGVRFQGVFTLPVCDGGSSDGPLPCCCGPACGETTAAWAAMGIPKGGGVQRKCKAQCPTCASGNGALKVSAGGGVLLLAISAASLGMLWVV